LGAFKLKAAEKYSIAFLNLSRKPPDYFCVLG